MPMMMSAPMQAPQKRKQQSDALSHQLHQMQNQKKR
jgi:hypothetical protein